MIKFYPLLHKLAYHLITLFSLLLIFCQYLLVVLVDFAVLFVFVLGRTIRNIYLRNSVNDTIPSLWKRVILLYILFEIMYSYGFDWVLIDITSLTINYFIFKKLTIAGKVNKLQTI